MYVDMDDTDVYHIAFGLLDKVTRHTPIHDMLRLAMETAVELCIPYDDQLLIDAVTIVREILFSIL